MQILPIQTNRQYSYSKRDAAGKNTTCSQKCSANKNLMQVGPQAFLAFKGISLSVPKTFNQIKEILFLNAQLLRNNYIYEYSVLPTLKDFSMTKLFGSLKKTFSEFSEEEWNGVIRINGILKGKKTSAIFKQMDKIGGIVEIREAASPTLIRLEADNERVAVSKINELGEVESKFTFDRSNKLVESFYVFRDKSGRKIEEAAYNHCGCNVSHSIINPETGKIIKERAWLCESLS